LAMGGCVPRGEPKKSAPGWVGDTKSPPRPGAHNAIIADLALPVVPAPRGGRTWLRGVLVVGDRCRVGDPRAAVACAGQHGGPRRTTREGLPPCDRGRHPVHRGGMRQLPVEVPPAGTVSAVFACWARGGAWQRILDALRDRLRVRAGGTGARPRRSSTPRRYPPPTPCPDPAAAGMAARERTA